MTSCRVCSFRTVQRRVSEGRVCSSRNESHIMRTSGQLLLASEGVSCGCGNPCNRTSTRLDCRPGSCGGCVHARHRVGQSSPSTADCPSSCTLAASQPAAAEQWPGGPPLPQPALQQPSGSWQTAGQVATFIHLERLPPAMPSDQDAGEHMLTWAAAMTMSGTDSAFCSAGKERLLRALPTPGLIAAP